MPLTNKTKRIVDDGQKKKSCSRSIDSSLLAVNESVWQLFGGQKNVTSVGQSIVSCRLSVVGSQLTVLSCCRLSFVDSQFSQSFSHSAVVSPLTRQLVSQSDS